MDPITQASPAYLRSWLSIPTDHTISSTTTTTYILDGSGAEVCHGDTFAEIESAWLASQ